MHKDTFTLLRVLIRSGKIAETRLDAMLAPTDLTATKLFALERLTRAYEPLLLSQLATCLAFVKSNATQLIDKLEHDLLVQRIADADDRRCTLVTLTAQGEAHCQTALDDIQPMLDKLDALYTPDERARLVALLRRLDDSPI